MRYATPNRPSTLYTIAAHRSNRAIKTSYFLGSPARRLIPVCWWRGFETRGWSRCPKWFLEEAGSKVGKRHLRGQAEALARISPRTSLTFHPCSAQVCTFRLELLCMHVVGERAGKASWAVGRSWGEQANSVVDHPASFPRSSYHECIPA